MDAFKAFTDAKATEAWRQTMFQQFERFWEGQRRLLDEYQAFSRAMLERRRVATEATLDAVRKLGTAGDASDWAKCYTDWLSESLQRMAEDSRDIMQEGMKVMAEVSQSVTASVSETAQATAEAQRTTMKEAAAAQSAAADQGAAMAQEAARAAKVPPRPPKRPEELRPGAAE
jgi:hypothetical protein